MLKTCVYTSVFGSYDQIREPNRNSHYVSFTDNEVVGWQNNLIPTTDNPRKQSRHYKTLPHRYLPDYDVWIWIDGNISLVISPDILVKELDNYDIALFSHPKRKCAYDEAHVCIDANKDSVDIISKQREFYRKDKFPEKKGLFETGLIVRRNTEKIRQLNELWWQQIDNFSIRDQISLPYCLWKLDIKYKILGNNLIYSPWINYEKHK